MSKSFLRLRNEANPTVTLQVEVADTFLRRFRGLMLRKSLLPAHALLLVPCSSVHMCWMRFAIDAVYLDKNWRILKIASCLRPWLGLSSCRGAWGTLELAAGEAARLRLAPGQTLVLEE